MKNIVKYLLLSTFLVACDDFFEPAVENNQDFESIYENPSMAQGVLANVYLLMPYPYYQIPSSDYATDDAVINEIGNAWQQMATGSWTAENDPTSQWQNRYNAIQYVNLFLKNVDKVKWAEDERIKRMFCDRFKGEAYAFRALNMYYLVRAHSGWTANGELLGVPIKTKPEDKNSDFNQPRDTFKDCIESIFSDCSKALEYLPLDYLDHTDNSDIPDKYKEIGITDISEYNRVFGDNMKGRITGRIVEAIRAQVALLAASPAYNSQSGVTWKDAADYAAVLLDNINGVNGLDADGNTWYCNTSEIDGLSAGNVPDEIIWRSNIDQKNDLEAENYPPTLYGKGRVNPSQNLVDAFPMANGYPITDKENSGYDENNPYENRDPRLKKYILVNEDVQGINNSKIITGIYGSDNNGLNKENGRSTRTGFYLKKLLRQDCNLDPTYNTVQKHYNAYIRYTDIFLSYAEAANEAWGPTGTGSHSYSAYDVIKAIRQRAGITKGDLYLEYIKSRNDKDMMRDLIRNERRLELCFEGSRFYDLRRWNSPESDMANLTETVRGVKISKDGEKYIYSPIDVEPRVYEPYMNYGPIPLSECLKYDKLIQNKGWE